MAERELLLLEVETGADGKQSAKRIVRECSVAKAARMLEVHRDRVIKMYHAGILRGWQPGLALARARAVQAGKREEDASKNCKVVLDWDSVVEYRETERKAQALARGVE